MAIHWTLEFQCSECNAEIKYEDEKLDWQKEDFSKERAEAIAYIKEHRAIKCPMFGCNHPKPIPEFVRHGAVLGPSPQIYLEVPDEREFVECPACGGKAFKGDGKSELDVIDAVAMSEK